MTDIKLPARAESAVKLHGKRGKQLSPEAMSFYTAQELRARDIEVARVVLEAAIARVKSRFDYEAAAMAHHAGTWYAASQYHADRVTATSQMLDILSDLKVSHD